VPNHCRQVLCNNENCGRVHFYSLECKRKEKRPRLDQSCCGQREWVLETINERCKHPECMRAKGQNKWWSRILDGISN
jgi:hypothetical protein